MSSRLILWPVVMACVGFFILGKGSYEPLGMSISGALLGAVLGLLLASMFARRAKRKHEPRSNFVRR
jgi:membrane associated rhomboid family serine protease